MINLELIKDLLEWHSYVYVDSKIPNNDTNEIHANFESKYCSLENKETVLHRYFYLLKRYRFTAGTPPDKSSITKKGQEFYDLLKCPLLEGYIKSCKIKLESMPLSIVFKLLKKELQLNWFNNKFEGV